jgi:mannose-6-phosphate isomerase-like protein (cupin superfamily)
MSNEAKTAQGTNVMGVTLDAEGMTQNLEGMESAGDQRRDAVVFRYRKPPEVKTDRAFAPLVRSDILFSSVQIIRKGGENTLHSHAGMDGFWFVLNGRARFYGEGDKLIAEVGQHEGVFVPRNVKYWFEAAGDEVLELLQVEAIDKRVKNTVTRHAPKKVRSVQVFKPDARSAGAEGGSGGDAA